MKSIVSFIMAVSCMLLFTGCAELGQDRVVAGGAMDPTIVFRPTDCSYVLACLNELNSTRGRDFDLHFKAAEKKLSSGDDRDKLRFICLALNKRADYRQFKKGMEVLRTYIEEHPESGQDLQGLKSLVDRLDQAKINRWIARKKLLDRQEELEAENDRLQSELSQAQVRIKELQNQIEQLKNIENIIKNRER
ncbi:hypothetical protein ACLG6S_07700 [Thermodesulfobacteriota bacterium B35]